ncbi:hypothetical protein FRC01_014421, partial [Tulasnella sp. 417]
MGEAVLQHEANRLNLPVTVDSAGTAGYHVGDTPDERQDCGDLRKGATILLHGVPINHQARQVEKKDFKEFNYILASDHQNLSNLQRIAPKNPKAHGKFPTSFDFLYDLECFVPYSVALFGSFGDGKAIADPYYG